MEQKNETVTELFNQLHPLLLKERCYYDFKRICEKIDSRLRELHAAETDETKKQKYLQGFYRLSHTIGKEVGYIQSDQEKMHKKNAAKIRRDEYYKAVQKAYNQVHSDILSVLIRERDEKEKGPE